MNRTAEKLFLAGTWAVGWVLVAQLRPAPIAEGKARSRSVIVPARNEAQRLPSLLQSLAAQLGPEDELIVVDDSSTDNTADVATPFAKVISVEPPAGWLGKPWACWTGAQAATGDVLVFIDSDVEIAPGLIDQVAGNAVDSGGLVSMQPEARTQLAYEELSAMPNAISTLGAGTGSCGVRTPWTAPMAFGPVMAIEAEQYARCGGHREVRDAVAEDVALAAVCAERDVPVHAWLGAGLVSTRMYPDGFVQMTDGWAKNLSAGASSTAPLRMAAVVAWLAGALHIAYHLRSPKRALAYAAFALQAHQMFAKVGRYSPLNAVVYPVSSAFFLFAFAKSVFATRLRRTVAWRGRDVNLRG